MKLVNKGLKSWIEEIRNSEQKDDVENEQYWNSMFESYVDIIQIFEIIEMTFNRLVLFYIVHTSSNTLLEIWIRIELQTPDSGDIQYAVLTCMIFTWALKNLILLSSLSVTCERFYSTITEVQNTCIQIITSGRCSVQCVLELPAEDSYGIVDTEWAIRNTVNNLFSTLKLKVVQQKLKLKQYSTIHNFFASITLRDHDNLKKISKLTQVATIDNGTQVFITQLNEVLNEDNKSNEETDSVYITILIEDFISRLDNLKERTGIKNNTKFDLNKAILRHFNNNENEFENTTYLSKESVKGNNDDDDLLSSNEYWQPSGRRIFDGKSSDIDRFPFMVSVQFFKKFQCGGSIIKSDVVITAASCLQIAWNNRFFRENPAFLSVQVGSTYCERGGENIPVLEIEFHPGFNPKNLKHNLALMRLTMELKFREKKRNLRKIDFDRHPWPLPSNTEGIVVVGWGAKTFVNKLEVNWKNELSYSTLDFYPLDECQDIYSKESVTDRNFCAGFFSKAGGACNHDAGGPGVSSGILVGVISFASPQCGTPDAPTVFTKLGYYSDWIEEVLETNMTSGGKPTTLRQPSFVLTLPAMTVKVRPKITPIVRTKKPVRTVTESELLRGDNKKHDFSQFLKTMFKKKKQPEKQQKQIEQKQKQEAKRQEEEELEEDEERQEEKELKEVDEQLEEEEEIQEESELQEEELLEEEDRQEESELQEEEDREKEDDQQEEEEYQEEEERQEEEEQQTGAEERQGEEKEDITDKEVNITKDTKEMEEVKPKQLLRNMLGTEINKGAKLSSKESKKKSNRKEKMTWTEESHSEDETTTIRPSTIFGSSKAKVTVLNDKFDGSSAEISSEKLTPSFKQRNDGNKKTSSGQVKEFDKAIDSLLNNLNMNYISESKESSSVDDPQLLRTKDLKSDPNLTDVSKNKQKNPSIKNLNASEEYESEANNGFIKSDASEVEGDIEDGTNEFENDEQNINYNKSVVLVDKSSSTDNVESHSNDNHENEHREKVVPTVNNNNETNVYETDNGGNTDEDFETLSIPAESMEQENSSNNSTDRLLDMLDYEDLYKLRGMFNNISTSR